jgi:subtilisin family serine protease
MEVVPNRVLEGDLGEDLIEIPIEEDPGDYSGHGTVVAAIAAGIQYGVASNANLHLIKASQRIRRKNPTETMDNYKSADTLIWALGKFWDHFQDLSEERQKRGAVVNLSWGLYVHQEDPKARNRVREKLMTWWNFYAPQMEKAGIVFVFAAGNRGEEFYERGTLDQYFPSLLAVRSSSHILVGAVHEDGTLLPETRYETSGEGDEQPEITVWAQGSPIDVPYPAKPPGAAPGDRSPPEGTSFAAPAVVSEAIFLLFLLLTIHRPD